MSSYSFFHAASAYADRPPGKCVPGRFAAASGRSNLCRETCRRPGSSSIIRGLHFRNRMTLGVD